MSLNRFSFVGEGGGGEGTRAIGKILELIVHCIIIGRALQLSKYRIKFFLVNRVYFCTNEFLLNL